jgi:hypothetical protein
MPSWIHPSLHRAAQRDSSRGLNKTAAAQLLREECVAAPSGRPATARGVAKRGRR